MNLKIITVTGILLFSVAVLAYTLIDEVLAAQGTRDINIVNNLDVPLEFKEIKNREHIKIKSSPPNTIEGGETGVFKVTETDMSPYHLNVKYYINNATSGEQVGIEYKWDGLYGNEHCPKDHPDWITEEVKHCGFQGNKYNKDWQYIFSPK